MLELFYMFLGYELHHFSRISFFANNFWLWEWIYRIVLSHRCIYGGHVVFRTESLICPFRKNRVNITWPQKNNVAFRKKHLLSLWHFHCCRTVQRWKIRMLVLFYAFFWRKVWEGGGHVGFWYRFGTGNSKDSKFHAYCIVYRI